MHKKITIVIPCLNEETVISDVIKNCWDGLEHDRRHQILVIDSSTDRSAEIAQALGAEVVKRPARGLGQAYIDSLPHITGDYVIMGDADGTYDYRELSRFTEQLDAGYEFVMGSRFEGWIEDGAMPKLHRYFGTPLTNWIFNLVYRTHFTDIHCGLRAMTSDALRRIQLQSTSWEYASEMIIKAVHLQLKTTEVPIHFSCSKHGRVSHVKRGGWFTPWYAGWITLQQIFTYGAHFFLFVPGAISFVVGFATIALLSFGPVGRLQLHSLLLATTLAIIGMIGLSMGIFAQIIYDYSHKRAQRWQRIFSYTRSVITSAVLVLAGILLTLPLLSDYIQYGLSLPNGIQPQYYASVTGLFLVVAGFFLFTHTLLIHALVYRLAYNSTYSHIHEKKISAA